MKTTGRCVVAIEDKKGTFWQVALNEKGQAFVMAALEQYFSGTLKVIDNKLPIKFESDLKRD